MGIPFRGHLAGAGPTRGLGVHLEGSEGSPGDPVAGLGVLERQHPLDDRLELVLGQDPFQLRAAGQVHQVVGRPIAAVVLVPLLKEAPGLAVPVERVVRIPITEVHPVPDGLLGIHVAVDIEADHLTGLEFRPCFRLDPRLVPHPDQEGVLQLPEERGDVTPLGEAVAPAPLVLVLRIDQAVASTRTGDSWQC